MRDRSYQGLTARGLPDHIAQGFLANFQVESGLNPGINEIAPIVPGSRGGWGLAQWTGPRRRQFEAYAGERGAKADDLDTQLDFLMHELGTTEKSAAKSIFAAQTPEQATRAISEKFLRPGIPHLDRRLAALNGGGGTTSFMPGGARNDRLESSMDQSQEQEQRGAFGIKPELAMALAGGFYNLSRPGSGDQFLQNAYAMKAQGAKDAKAKKGRNATTEWLRKSGYGEFADLVDAGAVSAGDAFGVVMKERAQQAQPNQTNDLIEYEYAKAEGFKGSFVDFQQQKRAASRTQITNNVGGNGAPGLGKLSTDFGYVVDPETMQPVIDPATGLPTAAPVPGSPAATEAQVNEAAKRERASQAERSANIVLQDIDRAIEQSGKFGTTGAIGGATGWIGGTDAHDLQNTLRTVQANIGFDRLQQMREASPTGGALGAVSERELTELQAVLGSIQPTQSKEQLQRNLTRLKGLYTDILAKADAYPNAEQFGFGGSQAQGGGPPAGIDPADWEYMTPEEKALFQ
jgi:hypothetical protein